MQIVPAIDEVSPAEFKSKLAKLTGLAKRVQIDFDDGSFGGIKTVSPVNLIGLELLPETEAHLMVQKPLDYIHQLIPLGVRKIILQFEIAGPLREYFESLFSEDILLGLSVAPETPIAGVEPMLEFVDCINILTVHPGRQGQEFLPDNLSKITDLRNINFLGEIEVDGGINDVTLPQIIPFNPDTLIVGSYIWKSLKSPS